jgi:uncharacterized protein
MELSRYTSLVEVDPGTWIAFNHTRGTWIRPSGDVLRYLRGDTAIPMSRLQRHLLHEKGFCVASRQGELDMVRSKLQYVHFGGYGLRYTLVMTYACNLRCPYCYEEGARPERRSMSPEMGRLVVETIKRESRESGIKDIGLTLYGGEPLLNLRVASSMLKDICGWADSEGARVRTALITNGVLVTKAAIKALGPSLDTAQLTLEGAPEHHDRVRVGPRGAPTFARILAAAQLLLDHGIMVSFRIQLSPRSLEGAEEVLQALADARLLNKVGLHFFPILDIQNVCSDRGIQCFKSYFSPEIRRRLFDLALHFGVDCFPMPAPVWVRPYCSFINLHAWLVDPHGHKYKCVALVGDERWVAGTVTGEATPLERQRWLTREMMLLNRFGCDVPGCVECECLPACDSGCGYLGRDEAGQWNPHCEMHKSLMREWITYRYHRLRQRGEEDQIPCI